MSANPRILICDDDPLMLELVEFRLRAKGFEVLATSDGETALDETLRNRPDLLVLDAMLPGMDGFELLKQVKQTDEIAHIPVIMLTARKTEQDIVSALENGAADYLVKPFIPDELIARIQKYLPRTNDGAP